MGYSRSHFVLSRRYPHFESFIGGIHPAQQTRWSPKALASNGTGTSRTWLAMMLVSISIIWIYLDSHDLYKGLSSFGGFLK